MKFATLFLTATIALLALVTAASAEDKTTSVKATQFAALKALAGDWVEVGKDGKPTDKLVSSFRVTANGSAVEETNFPGTPHEMVTMYHLDGEDLVLTHYCALGNQPKMRLESGKDVNRLAFRFVSASNLKSENDTYMSQATLTLVDKDHFQAEWVSCKEGKACHTVSLDLVRKSK